MNSNFSLKGFLNLNSNPSVSTTNDVTSTKTITKTMLSIFLLGAFSFVFVSSVYAVTVPSGTITDPTVQGYPGCTPGNCAVQSSSSSSLPTATMYGQVVVWDGSAWVATTTLTASTTAATTTLNLTAVVGATSTGIFFLDANGKLSQDTDNFNYNPVTKKLTLTGGLDPLWVQAKDSTTFGGAYFEAYDGNNAGVSLANTGRLRYSTSTQAWEVSTNGGAYAPIVVSGSNIVLSNATITNATITNAVITNGTSTNFFATLFSAITGIFTNLFATNATITNATTTNLSALSIRDSFGQTGTVGQVLSTTGTSTRWVAAGSGATATGTYQAVQFTDGAGNFIATSTFTYGTTTGLQFGTSQRIAVDTAGRVTSGHFDVTAAPVPGTSYYMDLDLNGTPDVINGSITLVKGQIYRFYVNTPSDPFYLTTNRATAIASAYNTGVSNNGATSGIITFLVPQNAPSKLYYQSSANAPMGGSIYIVDPSTIANENNAAYVYATTTAVGDIVQLFASSTNVVTITGSGAILNGTTTIATATIASSSIGFLNVLSNLWAAVLSVVNLNFINATGTNATTTNFFANIFRTSSSTEIASTTLSGPTLSLGDLRVLGTTTLGTTTITSIQDSYGTFGTVGQYLITTGTSTRWSSLTAANVATGTYQAIQFNDGANNLTATSSFAYSTTTGLRFTNNRVAILPNGTVIAANFDVTNSPTLSYNYDFDFNGIADVANPSITLVRGYTYNFNINTPGDSFYIKTAKVTGTGSQYTNGIAGNGTSGGVITFTVPQDAPSVLYYQSSNNSAPNGTIYILDSTQLTDKYGTTRVEVGTTTADGTIRLIASGTEQVLVTTVGTTLYGTTSIATATIASTSIVWANITNLFASILNVLNFTADNATITNATSTNIATGNINATNTATLASTTLVGNTIAGSINATTSLNVSGTSTLATTTISTTTIGAANVSGDLTVVGNGTFATTTAASSSITFLNVLNTLWANMLSVLNLNFIMQQVQMLQQVI